MKDPNSDRSHSSSAPIAILGVPFDNVTTLQAVENVEAMLASDRPHFFVTPNVDFLVQARRDVELRRILLDAHLVLCDGMPLVWASHLLGNPLPERVAGADLVPLLVRLAAERNYRIFFLGGSAESAAQAVARLKAEHPQLSVAAYSPPFDPLLEMDHDEIKRRIQQFRPHFLFVSFGCPKQEKWLAMHYQSLGVPVAAGVGGTIDFLAGHLKRAPIWMQRIGAEWIFRLLQEPRRLIRRYVEDLWVFGWAILAQWWTLQFQRNPPARRSAVRSKSLAAPSRSVHLLWTGARLQPSPVRCQPENGPAHTCIQPAWRKKPGRHTVAFMPPRFRRCWNARPSQPGSPRTGQEAPGRVTTTPPQWERIIPGEKLDVAFSRQSVVAPQGALADDRPCLLDLSQVQFVDSAGVAWLLRLSQGLRAAGRPLVLLAPSRSMTRALNLLRVQEFFETAADLTAAGELIATRLREQGTVVSANSNSATSMLWQGEITTANAEAVWRATEARITSAAPPRKLVIDLSRVRFIDSAGLGLLERTRKLAQRRGLRLDFTGARPAVRNVLHLARWDGFLRTEPA
jgi:exopolysaccharide biosynthesis WecB/TagA/CpsF family protein/anti-anti-sigma factor